MRLVSAVSRIISHITVEMLNYAIIILLSFFSTLEFLSLTRVSLRVKFGLVLPVCCKINYSCGSSLILLLIFVVFFLLSSQMMLCFSHVVFSIYYYRKTDRQKHLIFITSLWGGGDYCATFLNTFHIHACLLRAFNFIFLQIQSKIVVKSSEKFYYTVREIKMGRI